MSREKTSHNRLLISWIVYIIAISSCFALFWTLRAWNLENGDGVFCAKNIIGEKKFPITLSRSMLTFIGYRGLYAVMNGWFGWWPDDAIALGGCLAGLVFVIVAYRLGRELYGVGWQCFLPVGILLSTYLLQVYCGEVEFYAWVNTGLFFYAYVAFRVLRYRLHPLWASLALTLATGFHASAIFSFPSLLWLQCLYLYDKESAITVGTPTHSPPNTKTLTVDVLLTIGVFVILAVTHRNRLWWGPIFGETAEQWMNFAAQKRITYPVVLLLLTLGYFLADQVRQRRWRPWLILMVPWLLYFTFRSMLGIHPEPLLGHIPPFSEPYDTGTYFYKFNSWDHFWNKFYYHLWITPFGLPVALYWIYRWWWWKQVDRWVQFLLGMAFCAFVWCTFFYPALLTRDWDLFVSFGIPFNLLLVEFLAKKLQPRWAVTATTLILAFHLTYSVPFVIENAQFQYGRGYSEVEIQSEIESKVFIRGLELGQTPFHSKRIRSGPADLRVVPIQPSIDNVRTTSKIWEKENELMLPPGKSFKIALRRQDLLLVVTDDTPNDSE